mgnify:CR=1 FL=1
MESNKRNYKIKNLNKISDEDLFQIGQFLFSEFSNDYKTFITWSNGGEGEVGGNYISLWKIEDIITLNNDYQIQKYLSKDFLAIGTDGGGVCYGFNLRDNFSFFKCPLGDLDINELSLITKSFKEFFEKAMIEEI